MELEDLLLENESLEYHEQQTHAPKHIEVTREMTFEEVVDYASRKIDVAAALQGIRKVCTKKTPIETQNHGNITSFRTFEEIEHSAKLRVARHKKENCRDKFSLGKVISTRHITHENDIKVIVKEMDLEKVEKKRLAELRALQQSRSQPNLRNSPPPEGVTYFFDESDGVGATSSTLAKSTVSSRRVERPTSLAPPRGINARRLSEALIVGKRMHECKEVRRGSAAFAPPAKSRLRSDSMNTLMDIQQKEEEEKRLILIEKLKEADELHRQEIAHKKAESDFKHRQALQKLWMVFVHVTNISVTFRNSIVTHKVTAVIERLQTKSQKAWIFIENWWYYYKRRKLRERNPKALSWIKTVVLTGWRKRKILKMSAAVSQIRQFIFDSTAVSETVVKVYAYRRRVMKAQAWVKDFLVCKAARLMAICLTLQKIKDERRLAARRAKRLQEKITRNKLAQIENFGPVLLQIDSVSYQLNDLLKRQAKKTAARKGLEKEKELQLLHLQMQKTGESAVSPNGAAPSPLTKKTSFLPYDGIVFHHGKLRTKFMDPEEWVLKLKQTESGTKYFRFLCSVLKYQRIRHINDFHNLENRRKNQKSFVNKVDVKAFLKVTTRVRKQSALSLMRTPSVDFSQSLSKESEEKKAENKLCNMIVKGAVLSESLFISYTKSQELEAFYDSNLIEMQRRESLLRSQGASAVSLDMPMPVASDIS